MLYIKNRLVYNMTIFDGFGIFSNFLFLEIVTLAYLINSQLVAANVGIFGNVWACTSEHLPSSFNPWLTLLNFPFETSTTQHSWSLWSKNELCIVNQCSKNQQCYRKRILIVCVYFETIALRAVWNAFRNNYPNSGESVDSIITR